MRDEGITAYAADVTALDALNSGVVRLHVNDDRTALQAIDQLAESIGVFFYFDHVGEFRMGQLVEPFTLGTNYYLYDYEIINVERRQSADINTPIWKTKVLHTHIETVQTSDLGGAVTPARRARLAKEYLTSTASNTAVSTVYLLAKERTINSRLVTSASADAEAARQQTLHGAIRAIYEITIPIERFKFKIMDIINVNYTESYFPAGLDFALIGYTLDMSANVAILSLWGDG